jgi:hypothetical protein
MVGKLLKIFGSRPILRLRLSLRRAHERQVQMSDPDIRSVERRLLAYAVVATSTFAGITALLASALPALLQSCD